MGQGWVAARRGRCVSLARAALGAAGAAWLLGPSPGAAQLRPLEPLEWSVYEPGAGWLLGVGAGFYPEVDLSMTGTRGRLIEVGAATVALRFDRIALEAHGAMLRRLEGEAAYSTPVDGTHPPDGEARHDVGDVVLATTVRLTPARAAGMAVLRFGTRLPTTDNAKGMGRDQTDFFALVGGRLESRVAVSAEVGVGIHSTRYAQFEQADVLLYAVQGEYRLGAGRLKAGIVGQRNGFAGWRIRGVDDLSEARLAAELGGARWLRVQLLRGFSDHGVRSGVQITAGLRGPS